MEDEGFTHENSQVHSPKPLLGFQNDRFLKNSNNLNIPETIPEQSSTELSENSLKMEGISKSSIKCMDDNTELSGNQSNKSDESSASTITAVDNSYLINCEKRLLENSGFDNDNKSFPNNLSLKSGYFNELARKLGLNNETISTPKNVLRNQINMLSNEIAESEEFHDLEIQILKEENFKNDEEIPYSQLIEKYSELLELYSTLKNEYDEYRKEHEKLQYKTADCLENLCSQIEASDSSLNFSGTSFASFNTDIKSSTMMGNISEVEATIMNDATFLDKDPLSITQDGGFKTPTHLAFKSAKKLFPQSSNSNKKSTFKEMGNDITSKVNDQVEFNSDYNLRILDLETALCDKVQEVTHLEQRLFKLEDFMSALRSEHERISAALTAENQTLKKDLTQKAEQLEDLIGKLFTETVGLNPSLKDSLIDVSGSKLLTVFIETILESCKSVQNNLINEHNLEKAEWEAARKIESASFENLQSQIKSLKDEISEKNTKLTKFEELEKMSENLKEQLIQAKNIISTKDEEIHLLQLVGSKENKSDLDSAYEAISKLQAELSAMETAKNEIENRCNKLENTVLDLQEEVRNEKDIVQNLEKTVTTYKMEKESLNQLLHQNETRTIELETNKIKQEEVQNNLRKEIETYKNENIFRFKKIFNLLKEGKNFLSDIFSNINNETSETLSKLFSEKIEMDSDVIELLPLYTETIFTCYEEAKNKIYKEFKEEKAEWEAKKSNDITLIENLKNQLKFLSENNSEKENQISKLMFENEEGKKLCQSLREKLLEWENAVTANNEKILQLETDLTNMKEELYKQFNEEKAEWESNRTGDSTIIENLQNQVSSLLNKNCESEKKLSEVTLETENYKKVCDSFEKKLKDAESALISRDNQILLFETQKDSLKEELFKQFEEEKEEWKLDKKADLTKIENLQIQIKSLNEQLSECQQKLGSFDDLQKIHDKLKQSLIEAENIILRRDEEIKQLKSYNSDISQIQKDLVSAKETISRLESEITEIEGDKEEVKNQFLNLEKTASELHKEIGSNKKLLSEMEKSVSSCKNEKESLNQLLQQSEAKAFELQTELENSKKKQLETHDTLTKEIKSLKNENSRFKSFCNLLNEGNNILSKVNLNVLSESKDNLLKLISENVEVPPDSTELLPVYVDVIINCCERLREAFNAEYAEERAQWELNKDSEKTLINNLRSQITSLSKQNETNEIKLSQIVSENEDIKKLCDTLKQKLTESEDALSARNERILLLEETETFLKQEKVEWEAKRNDDLQEIKNLHCQIKSLNDKNGVSETKLSDFESKNEEFKKLCDSLKEKLTEYENIITDCQEKIKFLESQDKNEKHELLEKFDQEKIEWETDKTNYISKIENLQSQIMCLNEKNDDNENKLSNIVLENEEFKKICESLKEKLSESEKAVTLRNEQILLLEANENDLKKELYQQFNDEKSEWEMKKNSDLTLIENLQNQIKSLNEKNESSQIQLFNILSENEEFKKLCESLKEKLLETENIVLSREEQIRLLETQENDLKKELYQKFNDEKSEWETKKNNDLTLIENLQNQIKSLNEKNENSQVQLSSMLSENEEFKKVCESLKEKLTESEKTITLRNEQILLLETQENDLKKELYQKFNDEKSEWETKKNNDLILIENLQNQIKSLNEKNENSQIQLSSMVSENEEVKKLCESLKEKLLETENIVLSQEEQIRLLETQENDLKKELYQKFNDEKSEWETKKNNDLTLIENLQNQIKSLNEKNESSQVKLSNMLSENEEVKKLCESLKEKLLETENILLSREEQIRLFENQEANLKREKSELEAQKNNDFALIQNLQTQIKSLTEKNDNVESKLKTALSENEDLHKLCDTLKEKISELENIIIASNEQILRLEGEEANLKQARIDLAAAEEARMKLESHILKVEAEKLEMESLCLEYQKTTLDLKSLLADKENVTKDLESKNLLLKDKNKIIDMLQKIIKDIKEKLNVDLSNSILMKCSELDADTFSRDIEGVTEEILKGFDQLEILKGKTENENSSLKQQLQKCEEIIFNHESELKDTKKELQNKETMLLHEISLLKQEKENLSSLSNQINDLQEDKKNLTGILLDLQFCLDISGESMSKVISGHLESRKVFTERIKDLTKSKTESLKAENKNLKFNNDNLKEKIKELSKIMKESSNHGKEDIAMMNNSLPLSMTLRSKSGKNVNLCARRLDKLEEINHNLTELMTRVLTMTEFSHLDKLKFCSVREFPNISKQVVTHFNRVNEKINELKAANAKLDEECDSYAKTIKDLKQEAVVVWKTNKEKVEALNTELSNLREEKKTLESEKKDLLNKISKLDCEYQKLKDGVTEGGFHNCNCGNDLKKITDMKRTLLIKEQKILELQDIEAQNNFYKSQIKYLENALEQEKKKAKEEKEKNKKLQNELNEVTKNEKVDTKKSEENQILEQLRMCGSLSGGVVQEFVDKEKIRKLAKDIGLLKELCRARYAEIKRLETENAALRNMTPKNSNQMDSPIRSRTYNTRSKIMMKEIWKPGIDGKENNALV